ncbi:guanine nucleotide exchange protein smcr8a-like isoform X2 [Salvelinus fontinalis]|uniref:guanine nucleotide exchange protein smcr8a-like isoform X2 n=1 Tax=Salvelinus fontinalis TaxID=8038 RepID=UPI00248656A2|nr:guanine nucleotide exchange protein smcr8a-like isoform X2 [Salvelinus fontinalis]
MSKLTPAGSREKMIGAPDVVAFTKEDDFGEVGYPDPWVVPEEFSVPLLPSNNNANPWAKTSYAKFTKDFILISEFSEQVGPQPLLTIPDDPKVFGTFDLNYFSLRIMSVDYQASFVGHPTGSGYPRLSFVEDSRVVLGDSKEGAFAYVHHLTLYDLEARGFVRPFCMAYVSADERKIMMQFQELSLLFSRASECLKTGNRRAFARELQRKLRDLEYTRSVLQKEEGLQREAGPQGCYSAHAVDKANELAAMEKSIYEHRDLLRQITSYPLRPRRDPHAAHCQHCVTESQRHRDAPPGPDAAEEAGEERRQSYTPQLIKGKSAKCFAKRLKDLTELCEERFYEATVELLTHTERCFRGDLCYLYTRRLDRALRRKQNITNFLFEEELGEEEEEVAVLGRIFCSLDHTVGTDPHSHIHTPSIVLCPAPPESVEVLEVYPACPDNSAQQSEALTGEERLESSLSDLTMETQDQESSEGNKDSFSSDRSGGEEEEEGDQTPVFLLEAEEGGEGEGETHRVCEREGETEGVFNGKREGETEGVFNGKREGETGGVFNGKREGETEGVFNGKREGETGGVSNGKREGETEGVFNGKRERETEGVFNGKREGETGVFNGKREGETEGVFERGAEREEGGAETGEGDGQRVPDPELLVQMDTACCMSQEGFLYNSSPPDTLPAAGLQPGSLPLVVNQEPQALLPVQGVYGLGSPHCQSPGAGLDLPISSLGDTTSRGSDQDGSDCTMSASTGSERAGSPLGYGGVVTLRQKKRAGQGALRFVRQYPFALHALWSLLSGRTLVVLGSEEGRVRRLVSALALYVPGPGRCGERVQPWLSCPFSLADLQRWKLIGLQRMASPAGTSMLCSLSRYSRYISVLDADRKTLRCPGYRGTLLANVADHRTRLRRGSTYFLHLQNTLSRLAARAFLLSFTHHLHLPISHLEQRQEVEERTRGFLRDQLRLGEDDCAVLMYLSQLITQHYLEMDNTPGTTQQDLEANNILDPATGGAITPETGVDPTTGGAITPEQYLDPTTGGAITPEQYLDPATGGAITPEQYLDPTTGGAIIPETGVDPATGDAIDPATGGAITPETDNTPGNTQQNLEANNILDPATGGAITPEQYLDPATGGAIIPETGVDPATGGAITPEQNLDPATGGAITPEQYLDPATGGAITPDQYLDPITGGAIIPETGVDPTTGGAITPETGEDPTILQSAIRSRAPPSFTFNYTSSLLYKI